MRTCTFCGLVLAATVATAAVDSERATVPVYSEAAALTANCEAAIKGAETLADAIRAVPVAETGVDNVLAAWDSLNIRLEDGIGPAYLQAYVHPDPAVRAAGEDCILAYKRFETDLFQDPQLHARVDAVSTTDPVDAKLHRDLLDSFEDTGVVLPPARRALPARDQPRPAQHRLGYTLQPA